MTMACENDQGFPHFSVLYKVLLLVANIFPTLKRLLTVPGMVTLTLHGILSPPCTRGDRL